MGIKTTEAAVLQQQYITLDFLYIHFIIGIFIFVIIYFAIKLLRNLYTHLQVYKNIFIW